MLKMRIKFNKYASNMRVNFLIFKYKIMYSSKFKQISIFKLSKFSISAKYVFGIAK